MSEYDQYAEVDFKAYLEDKVRNSIDDNKIMPEIVQFFQREEPTASEFRIKIMADAFLYNMRDSESSSRADILLNENPGSLLDFALSLEEEIKSLSDSSFATPEDFKNSLSRQSVERDTKTLQYINNFADESFEHRNLLNDLISAGQNTLNNCHSEAYADSYTEIVSEEQLDSQNRVAKLKSDILSASDADRVMYLLEIHNNDYHAGEYDLEDLYATVMNSQYGDKSTLNISSLQGSDKIELSGIDALNAHTHDHGFNIHTMDHELYQKLDKGIRAEHDDVKCLVVITESLTPVYPALSKEEIKIASEEILYSVRDNVSAERAEIFYNNPLQIYEYLADIDIDILDLAKIKFTTPDEYIQSDLVQNLQRNLETLKQLNYLISNDRFEDKELGISNPDSLYNDFYKLISDTKNAGASILNDAHRDAYAAQYNEQVQALASADKENYSKLIKSVLNAESEHDALIQIDMYNEWFHGGQLDNNEIYQSIRNANPQNDVELSDISHDSHVYKMVAPVVEAKKLLESKSELVSLISETEANLSSYSIAKELDFDSKVTESLHQKLEFALPVFRAIKGILNEQPEKHSISNALVKDIDKLSSKITDSIGGSKQPKSESDSRIQPLLDNTIRVPVTSKMR